MSNTWIDNAIKNWKLDKVKFNNGASLISIHILENEIGIKLPADFILFYQVVDGFQDLDMNKNMFSIWPIEKIKEEYKPDINKNFVGFCDFLIFSYSIGFLKNSNGVFNDYEMDKPLANTFQEFINFKNISQEDPGKR